MNKPYVEACLAYDASRIKRIHSGGTISKAVPRDSIFFELRKPGIIGGKTNFPFPSFILIALLDQFVFCNKVIKTLIFVKVWHDTAFV